MTPDGLAALVVTAFTGDPDDLVDDAIADDCLLSDQPGEPTVEGAEAVRTHFMAYGGRREVAAVSDVFLPPAGESGRGGLAYTVWFRADSHAYGQHGRVLLEVDADGRISRWDGAWIELESDLTPWGGD